jgi:hypothetical protein
MSAAASPTGPNKTDAIIREAMDCLSREYGGKAFLLKVVKAGDFS